MGQGTQKNLKAAFSANARADHLGDLQALYVIAVSYEKGLGVSVDRDMADAAFLLAAELGHIPSMKLVRDLLQKGTNEQNQQLFITAQSLRKELKSILATSKLFD